MSTHFSEKQICTTADALADSPGARERGVAVVSRVWPAGQTIRIHFLNGTLAQQKFVKRVASLWLPHINLSFQWGVARVDSNVRVRFERGGSWSYVGTDNNDIANDRATMNFGWLPAEPDYESHRGVVLHEFGHMLGLSHEHQSPRNKLTWIRDAVIADLGAPPNEWSERQIERNVLFRFADDAKVRVTDSFDAQSIMTYSFPADWNEEGVALRRQRDLSAEDKRFVQQLYPFNGVDGGCALRFNRFWRIRVPHCLKNIRRRVCCCC